MAVVLVNARRVLYQQCFGKADILAAKPYTLHTMQPVGSVSKLLLAVALLKAIELGYFTLDTPINEVLPFPVQNPYAPAHVITIRELATHTSGIRDNPQLYPGTYQFHLSARPYSPAVLGPLHALGYTQQVPAAPLPAFYFNYLAPTGAYYSPDNFVNSPAGTTAEYSNLASALLAYLIEIKAGIPYSTFTAEHIFKPLHMRHSAWFTAQVKLRAYAQLYYRAPIALPVYDLLTYPEGGLKTTALDLSRFVQDMLKGFSGHSALLKPASFQAMFTPQFSALHPPAGMSLVHRNKGVLWNLYTNGTMGHDGDDPGVSALLFFNPSTGVGGVLLTNKYVPDKRALAATLTQAISR